MEEIYQLTVNFNWFGKEIPEGTAYMQSQLNKDVFLCFTPDGRFCPHWNLTYMTVLNNPDYFWRVCGPSLATAIRHYDKNKGKV